MLFSVDQVSISHFNWVVGIEFLELTIDWSMSTINTLLFYHCTYCTNDKSSHTFSDLDRQEDMTKHQSTIGI